MERVNRTRIKYITYDIIETAERQFFCLQKFLIIKKPEHLFGFLWWCLQESNQGHKDFQSFALPTELRHHRVSGCKYSILFLILPNKIVKNLLYFYRSFKTIK